jgi:hypothetical protein
MAMQRLKMLVIDLVNLSEGTYVQHNRTYLNHADAIVGFSQRLHCNYEHHTTLACAAYCGIGVNFR